MKRLNQFLLCRGGRWNYHRRVPTVHQSVDPRGTIRIALNTDSLQIARARRDALAEADECLWLSLKAGSDNAHGRYEAARKRAIARGFVYIPAQELAVDATLEQILERLDRIELSQPNAAKAEADAVLGLAAPKGYVDHRSLRPLMQGDLRGGPQGQIAKPTSQLDEGQNACGQ